jgi:hypothetical protein
MQEFSEVEGKVKRVVFRPHGGVWCEQTRVRHVASSIAMPQ